MDEVNLRQFYLQLDKHRQKWGLSWHKLASQAGVSSTVFTRMEREISPNSEELIKLQAWVENWGDRWV